MKHYSPLWLVLPATVLLLAGCQSARVPAYLPPVAVYAAAPHALALPVAPAPETRQAPATISAEPVILALLAPEQGPVSAPGTSHLLAIPPAPQQLLQSSPDTSTVRQQASPTPEQIKAADTRTTTANIFGIALLLLGFGMLIAGLASGGWLGLSLFVYGFIPLLLSIPFMLFRSKNSTRRLASEKRKAERKAASHN